MSTFADTIYKTKYSWKDEHGTPLEEWEDTAHRVVKHVLGALGFTEEHWEFQQLLMFVKERKFIPGGRYLYASGRDLHQTQNCLLLRAEDSREGWSDLLQKSSMALMTGAGIGIDYSDIRASGMPIRKTGGYASGPISLMQMVNEVGRHVMQGGSRRSAIWAGLNWAHPDAEDFARIKDWSPEVRKLKETDFNFPAAMDMTNISIILDREFFNAYENEHHALHEKAQRIYWLTLKQMVTKAEPGFSVDFDNPRESLRNAPVAADTHILTGEGYKRVGEITDRPIDLWTGRQWANNVVFTKTQENASILKVRMSGGREIRCEPNHEFLVERYVGGGARRKLQSVERIKASELQPGDQLHVSLLDNSAWEFGRDYDAYALGYLYGDGSFGQAGNAEISFCTDESKRCVGAVMEASRISSITEKDGRGYTRAYFKVDHDYFGERDKKIFPEEMYSAEGDEQVSFLAGLFDADGNWEPTQHRIRLASKHKDFLRGVARLLEGLGILAGISKAGTSTFGKAQGWQLVVMADYIHDFKRIIPTERLSYEDYDPEYMAYRKSSLKVLEVTADGYEDVYCADVRLPEHSFMAEGVIISNCTEVTSEDDSDVCNLGSINIAKVESLEEMYDVVALGTLFLLAGTVYSDLPYDKVHETRLKNRRLGLGVMGIHEWLLKRGKKYGADAELSEWLDAYTYSTRAAQRWARKFNLSEPVKTRAIAPTGTIGIIAETTTGIEPIFCVAYKRRYLMGRTWKYQYVVDPTAKRLVDEGVDPNSIEDAYTLAYDVERRVAFQAWVQQYVDHGISSTINMYEPIRDPEEQKEFGDMLMKYLPKLRGITVYPDGARGGQPLTPVGYSAAADHEGVVFEESEERCVGGSCGL